MKQCPVCGAKMFKAVSKAKRLAGASGMVFLIPAILLPFAPTLSLIMSLISIGLSLMAIRYALKPSDEIEYRCPKCKTFRIEKRTE